MRKGSSPIFVAGILYGTTTVVASLLGRKGFSALEISFFYTLFSIIPLLPILTRRAFIRKIAKRVRYVLSYSFATSLLLLFTFESLVLGLSPGITSLLAYTQPFWTIIIGRIFLAERMEKGRIGIVILALVGIFLVVDPINNLRQTNPSSLGIPSSVLPYAFALLGGICLSIWIIMGRRGSLEDFSDPLEMTFAVRGGSTVFTLIMIIVWEAVLNQFATLSAIQPIQSNLLILVLFSIASGLLPDFLFYLGVRNVDSVQAGLILLLEPISASVISVVLLRATFSIVQIVGGCLILISNYIALSREARNVPKSNVATKRAM